MQLPEVSVVMPVRNDQATLGAALADASAALQEIAARWELVVVEDDSDDATREVAREYAARESRIRVLAQPVALGLGAALRRGFDAAHHLVVATVDGSGRWDLRDLAAMFPRLRTAAVVAGVRSAGGSSTTPPGAVYRWLVPRLTGLSLADPVCPVRLLRMSFAQMVSLESSGATAMLELVHGARRMGLTWCEAPVTCRPVGGHEPQLMLPRLRSGYRELRALRTLS